MRTAATDPATKSRALQRAAEVGAAQASRETGVPAGTIRAWRARSAEQRAVSIETNSDIDQARRTAVKARAAAEKAIDRLNDVIPISKDPQRLSVAVGVMLDKAQMLADVVLALEERDVRLSEATGRQLAEFLRQLFDALGLPFGPRAAPGAIAKLIADLLRQTELGGVVASSPALSEPARAEIRRVVGDELRSKIEQEIREQLVAESAHSEPPTAPSEPLGLPVPGETETRELDRMTPPRQAVRVFAERQQRPDQADDVVEGEIVDDEIPSQWLQAFHGDKGLARAAWEGAMRNARDRELRARAKAAEPDLFAGQVGNRRSGFDVFDPSVSNVRSW